VAIPRQFKPPTIPSIVSFGVLPERIPSHTLDLSSVIEAVVVWIFVITGTVSTLQPWLFHLQFKPPTIPSKASVQAVVYYERILQEPYPSGPFPLIGGSRRVDFRDRGDFNSSTVAIPLAVQATDYSKHCKLLVQASTTGKDPARHTLQDLPR
jgi:hypothetical protein